MALAQWEDDCSPVPVEWTLKPTWMARGACGDADPALFFPERGESTREAKAVCMGCVVREECFDFAKDDPMILGIWGGTSAKQRVEWRKSH